jgi:AbrB family looped-hinge helix DNA binding protein
MALVKVKHNFQITLPSGLRKKCHIAEGDYVDVDVHEGGLFIKPVKMIDADQAYFWTRQWRKEEAEADRDIAEGRMVGPFDNIADALKALKDVKI